MHSILSVINVLSLENEYGEFDCEMFGFYPVSLPLGTVQATDVAFSCYSLSHLLTHSLSSAIYLIIHTQVDIVVLFICFFFFLTKIGKLSASWKVSTKSFLDKSRECRDSGNGCLVVLSLAWLFRSYCKLWLNLSEVTLSFLVPCHCMFCTILSLTLIFSPHTLSGMLSAYVWKAAELKMCHQSSALWAGRASEQHFKQGFFCRCGIRDPVHTKTHPTQLLTPLFFLTPHYIWSTCVTRISMHLTTTLSDLAIFVA